MFLKRFQARGFKSFADSTIIDFQHGMTGIVGPNGSGKSNIIDGLKWVLGEQSLKQLRGKQSVDFIFSGSDAREAANFAEVTLTFDNSEKILRCDFDEISVTRRLTRGIQKNEYFINNEPALLSEIKDIFLDTGLAKGSLGIISQGTVSWFIEAKPHERRKIFEDASGIGKYTLIKKDTLNQLNQTQNELTRAEFALNEIQKLVKKLSRQAEKAQLFLSKKEQLKKIEVNILARDILEYQNSLNSVRSSIKEKEDSFNFDDSQIKLIQHKLNTAKEKFTEIDKELFNDNNLLHELRQELNDLQNQKNKYELQLEQQLSSDKIEEKIAALNQFIQNTKTEIIELEFNQKKLDNEIVVFNDIKSQLFKKHEDFLRKISLLSTQINQKEQEQNNYKDQLENKYRYDYGLRAVMNAKNSLVGIYDVLENLIQIEPQHETAIGLALGRALKNIVVNDAEDAKRAIDFLKANHAGQATFLPINNLKVKYFSQDHYEILNHLDNFVGMANELVNVDQKFRSVVDSLLNRIIISVDLEAAIIHNKYTNSMYRIITLDGDQIAASGAISGGYNRKRISNDINLEEKIKTTNFELEKYKQELTQLRTQAQGINFNYHENDEKLNHKKQQLFLINSQFDTAQQKLKNYEWDFAKYETQNDDVLGEKKIKIIDELVAKLVTTNQKFEHQKSLVEINTRLKNNLSVEIQSNELEITNLASGSQQVNNEINELKIRQIKIKNVLENTINRLMDTYQLTPEYAIENFNQPLEMEEDAARILIRQLIQELKDMGNVNFEAVDELKNLEADLKYKTEQYESSRKAVLDLEAVIAELNQKAIQNYDNIVQETNKKLPKIFNYLFGGGSCKIIYDNPENILESGIEINAFLPGKTITSLMLFSGGEKTLIALSVLLAVLQVSSLPLVILDEAESALDPANVERFGKIIKNNSTKTQFITITHRPGTMEYCDILYGVTMMVRGISNIVYVELKKAMEYIQKESE